VPSIHAVTTALPPHSYPQKLVQGMARDHFAEAFPQIDRYLPVFDHAQIDTRYFAVPPEWYATPHSFKECNDLFVQVATQLSEEVARRALEQAQITAQQIDHVMLVTTTGLATPSIDARLINRLGMRPHTRRTPIWGLGCAGGIGGLARAYEYTRAFPKQRVLLVTTELCSLTFQWGDLTTRNLIATSLFADGAAAVVVAGDEVAPPSGVRPLNILGTQSTLWSDTLEVMGWETVDTGFQVVFSPRIPSIVQLLMRDNISELLGGYNLDLDDIEHWILHPGGAKVVTAYQSALDIDPERLGHTRGVLRDYGNMSSGTVFFVLERFLREQTPRSGEYGLLGVLGPGFSCELALVQGC
jgi:alkylresorcinol/alkylpyrone synthase